jgi:L-arabinokinase
MTDRLLYCVSGHGFGHATRSAEVIRALTARRPGLEIEVATTAPARFFARLPGVTVRPPAEPLDAGVVELDPLRPDPAATVERLAAVLRRAGAAVAAEAGRIRSARIGHVVADVPFLAGPAAAAAGVGCTAVSNFTWDWIYEPFLADRPDGAALLGEVRAAYAAMTRLLRLPLGGCFEGFAEIADAPLVARAPRLPGAEVVARLGLDPSDTRPRVLIATRGGLSAPASARAAGEASDLLFFTTEPPAGAAPANLRMLPTDAGLDFPDVLSVCAAAVGKLGYGLVTECLAAGTGLLYPPRVGFREDAVTAAAIPSYIRAAAMPEADFRSGAWADHLRALLAQPAPDGTIRLDGAAVCAERILSEWK